MNFDKLPRMTWLTVALRVAGAPLFVGAIALGVRAEPTQVNLIAAGALLVLGVIHQAYWWQPWPLSTRPRGLPAPRALQRRAVIALVAMIPPVAVLQHVVQLSQPLLWLYPALIAGSGLATPLSAVVVGFMALAAVLPVVPLNHPGLAQIVILGTTHTLLLAIVLAGLGMAAVRQLILVNADLQATKAELAELAVAHERERLARDLHDLLGRTFSLIAVKAELAQRLSAGREPPTEAELGEIQQLARAALRDVREALTAYRAPTVRAELAAARLALQSAGIEASVTGADTEVDPAHEPTLAWAIREAVTNVVKHSGARHCEITLAAAPGVATLEVVDDGWGPTGDESGSGLRGLAERLQSLGGTIEAGPRELGGFRVCVSLRARTPNLVAVR
jgi:two-component system sensor histidine kinase DesK